MKDMKISTRLFLGFGVLIILLITVVAIEYTMINSIGLSKDRFANAEAINESTLLTRSSTLEFYVSNSDEALESVEENYAITKVLLDEGLGIYNDPDDKKTIEAMKTELDLYYQSFGQYRSFVDQNDIYTSDMINSANSILSNLKQLIVSQNKDFKSLANQEMSAYNENEGAVVDLVAQMTKEYDEVSYSNEAVKSIESVMISELRYLLRKDKSFDNQLYTELDSLIAQCDWLYNNFESTADKSAIGFIRSSINDYMLKYEAYKQLLESQAVEEARLNDFAVSIAHASEEMAAAQEKKMKSDMTVAVMNSIIIGAISIVIGILMAIFISRKMTKQLTANMNQLTYSANQVSSASAGLAAASQQLSSGSAEQAASIEETSATMDETSSMVKQNADNTRQANMLSRKASQSAEEGSGKMKNMNESMSELEKSSSEIAKIIKVIDDIAFQTNMLALNAAVEAARAGDAGLGFAVVAQEVRNLAQKSAKAANDTSEIIDKNIALSKQGVQISYDVDMALKEIMSATENVNQIMSEIAQASEEQAKGTAQITQAIGEMEKVMQDNAATAEESAASAEELQAQSKSLEDVVYEMSKLVKRERNKTKKVKFKIQIKKKKREKKLAIIRKLNQKISNTNKK